MTSTIDTMPLWIEPTSFPRFAALSEDQHVDVVVVGGGITGLTAAYLLTAAGKSVAVLERRRCAEIDTGHTTAHLTMVTDTKLSDLVSAFGREHAQAAWDAGLAALWQIDAIVREQKIDCDFAWVPAYLHAPWDPARHSQLRDFEAEARLASELGFDAEFVTQVPLMGGPGIRFDAQARFHPRKYLVAIARAITAAGGRIYEHTDVREFCNEPLGVRAKDHTIECSDILLATHNPLMGVTNMASATLFQTKLALYTSYVIGGRVPKGHVPDALFYDTTDPYDYLRLEPAGDHDLVIFGGEDHKTGQVDDTKKCFAAVQRRLESLLPAVKVTHHWSGQVIETPDGLPYLGRNAEHQYIATGFAGNGMTFGTLGAMMAVDGILGRANPWTALFDPGRKKIVGAAWDYLTENKDYPYYLVRDRFAGDKGRSLRQIRRGQGMVLDLQGQRVAVYRREDGKTILRSAICTHMGCEVGWNTAERTWDCPCHGSRFDPAGQVLAGPAESPLSDVKLPE